MSGDNLSCQCQAGGSSSNKMSNNNMSVHWQPLFSHQLSFRCSCSDLRDPLLPCCHGNTNATGSSLKLTGADKNCRRAHRKAGGEKRKQQHWVIFGCVLRIKMISLRRKKKFLNFIYLSFSKSWGYCGDGSVQKQNVRNHVPAVISNQSAFVKKRNPQSLCQIIMSVELVYT